MLYYALETQDEQERFSQPKTIVTSTSAKLEQLINKLEQDDDCAQYQILSSRQFKFVAGTSSKFSEGLHTSPVIKLEPGRTYALELKLKSATGPFQAEWRNSLGKTLHFSRVTSSGSDSEHVAAHKLIFSPYERADCQLRLLVSERADLDPQSYVIVCQISKNKLF